MQTWSREGSTKFRMTGKKILRQSERKSLNKIIYRSVHNVTPLWCASVAGKYRVVDVLVRYGADVNSMSDTGSTPGMDETIAIAILIHYIFSSVRLLHDSSGHSEAACDQQC